MANLIAGAKVVNAFLMCVFSATRNIKIKVNLSNRNVKELKADGIQFKILFNVYFSGAINHSNVESDILFRIFSSLDIFIIFMTVSVQ